VAFYAIVKVGNIRSSFLSCYVQELVNKSRKIRDFGIGKACVKRKSKHFRILCNRVITDRCACCVKCDYRSDKRMLAIEKR